MGFPYLERAAETKYKRRVRKHLSQKGMKRDGEAGKSITKAGKIRPRKSPLGREPLK